MFCFCIKEVMKWRTFVVFYFHLYSYWCFDLPPGLSPHSLWPRAKELWAGPQKCPGLFHYLHWMTTSECLFCLLTLLPTNSLSTFGLNLTWIFLRNLCLTSPIWDSSLCFSCYQLLWFLFALGLFSWTISSLRAETSA